MSETETRIGKAEEIKFSKNLSFKSKVQSLIDEGYDIDMEDALENMWLEDDELFCFDERIFKIIEEIECNDSDICHATLNVDGTISYVLSYYNGGTCFNEMIEKAIKETERDDTE